MVGHIHIMIIELLMKLDVILKNVGCTVTKMLDHNIRHGEHLVPTADTIIEPHDVLYVSCRRGSLNEAKKYFKGEKEETK